MSTDVKKVLLSDDNKTPPKKPMNKALRAILAGVSLSVVATFSVCSVLYVQRSTATLISQNEHSSMLGRVKALLPEEAKVKGTQISCYQIKKNADIGHNQKVFVSSLDNKILGYVLSYSTNQGYSDPLVMICGFDKDKNVYKADIQFSTETPGLGDKVDRNHGNFLDQFTGHNLNDSDWEVKKYGGDFDYITGSTVTSRATVIATSKALKALNEIELNKLPKCKVY